MSSPLRFVVNSNSLFLCGTSDGAVTVLDTVTDLNSPSYSSDNWKVVAEVVGTITSNAMVTKATFGIIYRELEIFGVVIQGSNLDKLRDDLFNYQLLVNRDGYQVKYLDTANSQKAPGFGFVIGNNYMVKMNNVFGWGRYGVKPAMNTVWNRYDAIGGETVVDYVAAEERRREMAAELEKQGKEMTEWKLKTSEKDEILGHYKRMLEENKELMKEKESGKERLREVIKEKNRVVEEQSKVIKEKEMEIQSLKLMMLEKEEKKIGEGNKAKEASGIKAKVAGDDELKAAMDSFLSYCRKDAKGAIVAINRVFFVNVALTLLLFCVCSLRFFGLIN